MKNRHGIPAVLLALSLLIGNALLLPKLLTYAQALPDGEVVTQQTVDSTERIPLPEPPEGYGVPYELKFSRELTAGEQQMWDELEQEMLKNDNLRYAPPRAEIFYTERAREALIESVAHVFRPDYLEAYIQDHPLGDGAPGTILMDLGSVTLCIEDEPFTREAALPLMRMVIPRDDEDRQIESYVTQNYDNLYFGFTWMQPEQNALYTLTRLLCPSEDTRYRQLLTSYLLSGLRPSTPLNTTEAQDDSLWFDEQTRTIHLPTRYELTDDEILRHIELTDSLAREALLIKMPNMMTEQQAVEVAKDWAIKLFDRDVDALTSFAIPGDSSLFDERLASQWQVLFGPEDLLVQLYDDTIEQCVLYLDALDGALYSASCNRNPDLTPPANKTAQQVKADLEQKAIDIVQTLFEDGRKPKKVVINTYNFWEDKDSYNFDVDMPYEVSYVVSMANGVEYELGFTTGDYALIYYRYWPDGCENMG